MEENDLPEQVLVERGGKYELVDRRELITPEAVRKLRIYLQWDFIASEILRTCIQKKFSLSPSQWELWVLPSEVRLVQIQNLGPGAKPEETVDFLGCSQAYE